LGHGHTHNHDHGHRPQGRTTGLKVALVLTFLYMLAEGIGGWITNSLALIADAGHMLTDVAAMTLTLAAIWFARSEEHTSELQSHHDLVCRLLLEKKQHD